MTILQSKNYERRFGLPETKAFLNGKQKNTKLSLLKYDDLNFDLNLVAFFSPKQAPVIIKILIYHDPE